MDAKTLQTMITFVLAAIVELRTLPTATRKGSYGVHTTYGKLSAIFQAQFGVPLYQVERDSRGAFVRMYGPLADMVSAGAVAIRPVKGGIMVYNAKEREAAAEAGAAKRQEAAAAEAASIAARIAAKVGGTVSSGKAGR